MKDWDNKVNYVITGQKRNFWIHIGFVLKKDIIFSYLSLFIILF